MSCPDVVGRAQTGVQQANMLWIFCDDYKPKTPEDIDKIVCAELSYPDALNCSVRDHQHDPRALRRIEAKCTVYE